MTAAAWNFPFITRWPHLIDGHLAYCIDRKVFSLLPYEGMVEAILLLGALAQKLEARRDGAHSHDGSNGERKRPPH